MNEPLDINELLFRLLENEISDQDLARLKEWLRSDPEAIAYYYQFIHDYAYLSLSAGPEMNTDQPSNPDVSFNKKLWTMLAEYEKTAPADDSKNEIPAPATDVCEEKFIPQSPRKPGKTSLIVAITGIAALALLIAYLQLNPHIAQQEVATLVDVINPKWAEGSPDMVSGYRFSSPHDSMQLLKGVVKIRYDQGVELVVEGPAKFDFLSPSQYGLSYGKVYARVSQEGKGFTIVTSNSRITDLGTEFGVQRNIEGITDVHVFKGKTSLARGANPDNQVSQLITQGQAKRISSDHDKILDISISDRQFVRDISSEDKLVWRGEPLSLVSLVAGGTGLSGGSVKRGIDPCNGTAHEPAVQAWDRLGNQTYHPVVNQLCIDGVFVPNGKQGPVVVTSKGHKFEGFPETDSYYWADITTDARGIDDDNKSNVITITQFSLKGISFGENSQNRALLIHPNAGITFDLNQIRKVLPQIGRIRFKTVCGVPDNRSHSPAKSEFWILVDGKCQFHHQSLGASSDLKEVDILIGPSEQFLTLAATDGGDKIAFDWCLFVNPVLELASE
jgi:hypothetical protein